MPPASLLFHPIPRIRGGTEDAGCGDIDVRYHQCWSGHDAAAGSGPARLHLGRFLAAADGGLTQA
jgi:hypothetical protein